MPVDKFPWCLALGAVADLRVLVSSDETLYGQGCPICHQVFNTVRGYSNISIPEEIIAIESIVFLFGLVYSFFFSPYIIYFPYCWSI